MILFDVGDIVKIKDEYFEEFCCPKKCMGVVADKPISPYAVVLSYVIEDSGFRIGGKTIHMFPGDENRYRVIYGPDETEEDFSWWEADKFELVTNEIAIAWRNFCEASGWS